MSVKASDILAEARKQKQSEEKPVAADILAEAKKKGDTKPALGEDVSQHLNSLAALVGTSSPGKTKTLNGVQVGVSDVTNEPAEKSLLDPNDPIKSILSPVRDFQISNHLASDAETTTQGKRKDYENVKKNTITNISQPIASIKHNFFPTSHDAEEYLQGVLDKNHTVQVQSGGKVADVNNAPQVSELSDNDLFKNLSMGNETQMLALNVYLKQRNLAASAKEADGDLDKMSILYATKNKNITSKQITEMTKSGAGYEQSIPETMRGQLKLNLINDPEMMRYANEHPEYKEKVKQAISEFPDKYPQTAMKVLTEMISNEREKQGLNNGFLGLGNFLTLPAARMSDEIVDSLIAKGELPENYKPFYEKTREVINASLKTPGIVNNFVEGISEGVGGIWNTVIAPAKAAFQSNAETLREELGKDYGKVNFKPEGLLHKITTNGGMVTGQMLPLMVGGSELKALEFVSTDAAANTIMFGLGSAGNHYNDAVKLMPDGNLGEHLGYTALMTGFDMGLANMFNYTGALKGLTKDVQPSVLNTIKQFTEGKITAEVAKKTTQDLFEAAVKKLAEFTGKTIKGAGQGASMMASLAFVQNAANQAFTGQPFSFKDAANQAFDAFQSGFLGSVFLGAAGARAEMAQNPTVKQAIWEMTEPENSERIEKTINDFSSVNQDFGKNKLDYLENLGYAKQVRKGVDENSNMSVKDKTDYLFNSLQERIFNKKADHQADPQLQRELLSKANDARKLNKELLDNDKERTQIVSDWQQAILKADDEGKTEKEKGEIDKEFAAKIAEVGKDKKSGEEVKPKIEEADFTGLRDDDFAEKYFDKETLKKFKDAEIDNPELAKQMVADKKTALKFDPEKKEVPKPEDKKEPANTEDENLLNEIQTKTTSDLDKGNDLQYFVDKAAEDPIGFEERFGKTVTDKLLDKVPTEKLKETRQKLSQIGDTEQPSIKHLDEIIAAREKASDTSKEVGGGQQTPKEDNITVGDMIDKKGSYKGERGTFIREGQTIEFHTDKSDKIYELGNADEIKGTSIKDFGIEHEESVVSSNDKGDITVRGESYKNNYSDPLSAINYDKDGNVVSVNLETENGQKRNFRGQIAEDLAYQIHLKEISKDNESRNQFEQHLNEDAAAKQEMDNAGLSETAPAKSVKNDETVPREKIEPKINEENKPTQVPDKAGEGGSTEKVVNKDGEGSVKEPPKPPEPPKEKIKSPSEEWTAVRKEKNEEIKSVKELYDNEHNRKWVDTFDEAANYLQSQYPDKNLYEASRNHITELAAKYDDKNTIYNPSSRDIAIAHFFKAETERKMSEIDGWDSPDEVKRLAALSQFEGLNNDFVLSAKALNPHEAGFAFGLRQSETSLDPEYGLQIRRMELMREKGGEKLTDEEKEFVSDQWDKEKELMRQENEAREKQMQEQFDKKIEDLHKDYQEKLKQSGKPQTKEQKQKKLLSQSGKELADKLRSGKLKGGAMATIPGFPQAWNLVVETIAQIVEKGATLAEAIQQYAAKFKIEDEDKFKEDFFSTLDAREKRGETIDKITALSNSKGGITPEMVSKNLIRDYVNSHIGEVEPEKILDEAAKGLKEVLPDVTREQLTKAYLKEDEFKIPTKKKLETAYKQGKDKLTKIARIEKDIADLKEEKKVYGRARNTGKEKKADKDIADKEQELKKEMNSVGVKYSGEDKYTKASYDQRAKSNNDRIDNLSTQIQDRIDKGGLSDEQIAALNKLNGQLNASKIKFDPNSALSQKAIVENGLNIIRKIKSEFDRSLKFGDKVKLSDIKKGLDRIIDRFNSDKDQTEQDIKLSRAKDHLKSGNEELQRKINNKEFDEEVSKPRTKSDAELVKLQIERNKLESQYRMKEREIQNKNKSGWQKAGETIRGLYVASLIYKLGTVGKVAASSLTRPLFEAMSKGTFGQLFRAIDPTIYERAKAGGESSSFRTIQKSLQAYYRSVGEKKMQEINKGLEDNYNNSSKAYNDYKEELESKGEPIEGNKKLQDLKDEMNKDLLSATGNILYQFIGSSNLKDALEALLHRSNNIEKQFGYIDTEKIQKPLGQNKLNNLNYLVSFVGRSHSALKTFSARANFAAGFMARIEDAVNNGVDLSKPDNILQIGQDSYLDWERGKYTQSNFISDLGNKTIQFIGGLGKGTELEKYSKAVEYGLKFDVPITRVPVNILHEAVVEYGAGMFRAAWKMAQEYRKARKQVLLNEDILPSGKEFKNAIRDVVSQMDAKEAATIVRAFRKGGFGLGMFSLFALGGLAKFGGFHHKGEKKKKPEDMAEGELNPGELMFGDTKVGDFYSKAVEHLPAFYSSLMGLNWAKVKSDEVESGVSTMQGAVDGIIANLEAIQDAIPQEKIFPVLDIAEELGKGAVKTAEADSFWQPSDVDADGNLIKRHPHNFSEHIDMIFGNKKNVLTEENYKQAQSIRSTYKKAIEEAKKSGSNEEEIKKLESDRDEEIKSIYDSQKEQQ